ncbi:PhzF family phenazine biosynthesis protein [Gillisia sp. Hel_I_86]|uniref:PhzF family phenazine biosynthesis protein n=1 Tax=Gillisia sp. Hel_I_86 TaxID=1249981 RepID=UPI00119A0182|nr:PhzF family phenazine biosynthesis protein [Gillisia sp. Hel_I_86]TVZ25982.1 PhzF family phenazine biosynthesis protein [Gillisia sp. Hel_I_86]
MKLKIYQVDAFTNAVFAGNPACVVPLNEWLPDEVLLNIAKENAVAETAFFIKGKDNYHLRWFTPEVEMDLCGHATLASAHVIWNFIDKTSTEVRFETLSGQLRVQINTEGYTLNFPSRKPKPSELPEEIRQALSMQPQKVYKDRDFMLVYDSEEDIENLKIDRTFFDKINLGTGGVIITSKGSTSDFVSRFFTPQASILEDPVTGSAHCTLVPYWSEQLQKTKLSAIQLSERKGILNCEDLGDRVLISGNARTYLLGEICME